MPDEEKLKIAQHFLLSSPPGQFSDLLADVTKLLPKDLISPEMLTGIRRAYDIRHTALVSVDGDKDKAIVLCKEAELDATKYIDSHAKKIVKVDHMGQTATTVTDKPLPPNAFDSSVEEKRTQALAGLDEYLEKHFSEGRAACGAFSKGGKVTLVISGDKVNLKNYWSGSWTSTWTIDGDNNISGTTNIRAHYFEEGNVQLNSTKEFPSTKLTGDIKASVAEHIRQCEQSLHLALGAMYQNMSEETLKSMRRVMPITRSKMEWNTQAHKMVKQLHTK